MLGNNKRKSEKKNLWADSMERSARLTVKMGRGKKARRRDDQVRLLKELATA